MIEERIERAVFAKRFQTAIESDIAFAATMVRQVLPDSWRFLIEPNASYDGNAPVDDETLYPMNTLKAGDSVGPLTFEEALTWLWRNGKVPEWVDISVQAVNAQHTFIRLACCGRFTGLERRLYYRDALPPFGIKSPRLPAGWESIQASGRFDLPTIEQGHAREEAP